MRERFSDSGKISDLPDLGENTLSNLVCGGGIVGGNEGNHGAQII